MPARCATPHDLVAAFTGLRLGELRALRWRDVDFSNRLVHVRRSRYGGLSGEDGPAKSGKARSVPLIDQAARPLDALSRREQWTGPSDRVFCDERGRPLTGGAIREAFYSALEAAGIDRRAWATEDSACDVVRRDRRGPQSAASAGFCIDPVFASARRDRARIDSR